MAPFFDVNLFTKCSGNFALLSFLTLLAEIERALHSKIVQSVHMFSNIILMS